MMTKQTKANIINIVMLLHFIHRISILLVFLAVSSPLLSEIIPLNELNQTDPNYLALYESSIASKSRFLKHERKKQYEQPDIYRYKMKRGEDIWTLVARTSLTIDTIATLNRVDFIGMISAEKEVFLPDMLGIFFESGSTDKSRIIEMFKTSYGDVEDDILLIEDPLKPPGQLYFVPEVQLPFLERAYLTGVVFYAPLMGRETSGYGMRIDPFINEMTFHGGVDIAAEEGKRVHAARWGKVVYADKSNGYGNLVIIMHELGYYTLYGHLDKILVEAGDDVESGQLIGTVGSTGKTTGPHLHFEIRRFNKTLNPENIPFLLEHS